MSGMSNFPYQELAFLETVPTVPITIGIITITLDALWILLISSSSSSYFIHSFLYKNDKNLVVAVVVV